MTRNTSATQAPTTANDQGTEMSGNFEDMDSSLNQQQVIELLCQGLETEKGGIKIYETAIRCAQNDDLKEEWQKYLEETQNHERILTEVFETLELDPEMETPGRGVVRANGEALVQAMETALESGDPNLAQIVAAECVVLAETKDHLNWELVGEVAKKFEGATGDALREAYEEVEEQEDEHLYHTRGWARELWLESFGLPALLPPPEERKKVTSEIGAARAKSSRGQMLGGKRSSNNRPATKRRGREASAKASRAKPNKSRARSR